MLPIVDCLSLGRSDAADLRLGQEIDVIFRDNGFCYFRNTGIGQDLVDGLFAASRRFHAQDEASKRALAMNATHRGYMAPNSSVIVTSSVANVKRPNYSESLMLMHEVAATDPRFGTEVHGANQWPDLVGFRPAVAAYEAAIGGFFQPLLRPLGLGRGVPPDWVAPPFFHPPNLLSLFALPPPLP